MHKSSRLHHAPRLIAKLLLAFVLATTAHGACAQPLSIVFDFDDMPSTTHWWRDNPQVTFAYAQEPALQLDTASKACLRVRWDSIPAQRSWCWFTDLKIDSLANPTMEPMRQAMGADLWLSVWAKSSPGDTLWVQPLLLTVGHVGKWGARTLTPVYGSQWQLLKFRLADLSYENWGKIPHDPDWNSTEIRCFELGLRNGSSSPAGFIEAYFDRLMLSNFEP